eukprot:scaffold79803_cov32-Tisochrysis_lutea.AAC.4
MASPATLIPGQILRDAADSAVAVQNVHRKVHLHAPFAYCVDIGTRPAVSGGVEIGAFHPIVRGGLYYADNILVSDYNDHVPFWVWRVVSAYAEIRFALGIPLVPEGDGILPRPFWAFDLLDAWGISSQAQAWAFPLLVPLSVLTEILNVLLTIFGTTVVVGTFALAANAHKLLGRHIRKCGC